MRILNATEILPCLCTCDKTSLADVMFCSMHDIKIAKRTLLEMLCIFGKQMMIVYPVVTLGDFGNKEYVSLNYVRKFNNNFWRCVYTTGEFMLGKYSITNHCPDILYHGTSSLNLANILREGLDPLKAGQVWKEDALGEEEFIDHWSYLTDSLYAAEYFAHAAEVRIGGDPIILKVNVKGIKENLFCGIEQFEAENNPIKLGFGTYKEFWFEQPLPPNRIKDGYHLPTPSLGHVMLEIKEYFQRVSRT